MAAGILVGKLATHSAAQLDTHPDILHDTKVQCLTEKNCKSPGEKLI